MPRDGYRKAFPSLMLEELLRDENREWISSGNEAPFSYNVPPELTLDELREEARQGLQAE